MFSVYLLLYPITIQDSIEPWVNTVQVLINITFHYILSATYLTYQNYLLIQYVTTYFLHQQKKKKNKKKNERQ
jgi:hypothetical protein